jgi:hypothetical protein
MSVPWMMSSVSGKDGVPVTPKPCKGLRDSHDRSTSPKVRGEKRVRVFDKFEGHVNQLIALEKAGELEGHEEAQRVLPQLRAAVE